MMWLTSGFPECLLHYLIVLCDFLTLLPPHSLPRKNASHITAISWMKYYFADVTPSVTNHISTRVKMECHEEGKQGQTKILKRIKHNEVMKKGSTIYVPVSIAESRISKRFDTIPTASLSPNEVMKKFNICKDFSCTRFCSTCSEPPKVPLKGNLAVHNSMDALAAAALCYDYDEGPKLGKDELISL
ncbi:hypothetical protein Lser_V15G02906 [Lactuca serriola]